MLCLVQRKFFLRSKNENVSKFKTGKSFGFLMTPIHSRMHPMTCLWIARIINVFFLKYVEKIKKDEFSMAEIDLIMFKNSVKVLTWRETRPFFITHTSWLIPWCLFSLQNPRYKLQDVISSWKLSQNKKEHKGKTQQDCTTMAAFGQN